ncbi:MAG: glycine C-acetyltransferase [Planctomycetales bacterium]|nr:glycine C-acetyltransferase [Planctomycetales bacterium]
MSSDILQSIRSTLAAIESDGLFKTERIITSPQENHISVNSGEEVINFCANNYLGLSNHPEIVTAAHQALDQWGYGLSSVRFICGTQSIHKQLEDKLTEFLGTEDTILYPSCFDANGGLFETLLGPEDAVISDQLNHASIIDGVRLCKAKRFRYANNDMADLEQQLKDADAQGVRFKLITTDGVFSMDGYIAKLDQICELADKHGALVHFDDCHATGFMGKTGRGTHEHCGVLGRIDLTTGTLGKAMGGASGGYTSGRKEFIDLLRQRSRPYLFSNSVAPPIVGASLKALEIVSRSTELRDRLMANTQFFRHAMTEAGFEILPGEHPIVPVMLYDAKLAANMADRLLAKGIYVVGFSYPVVPEGKARIRTQISAAHTQDDLETAVAAFQAVRTG